MMSSNPVETKFVATQEKGEVSALLLKPEDAIALLVLGHDLGARSMDHSADGEVSSGSDL